jgi:hypothetical protein
MVAQRVLAATFPGRQRFPLVHTGVSDKRPGVLLRRGLLDTTAARPDILADHKVEERTFTLGEAQVILVGIILVLGGIVASANLVPQVLSEWENGDRQKALVNVLLSIVAVSSIVMGIMMIPLYY